MIDQVTAALMDAIEALKSETNPPSRQVSLAITKVEEALLWWKESQRLVVGDSENKESK